MAESQSTVSRRSFIVGCGVAAAGAATAAPLVQTALPWGTEKIAGAGEVAAPIGAVRSWYDTTVDAIVRAWELRFRFRQFRPDAPDDYEGIRSAPREELENALADLPLLEDEAAACLIVAVSPSDYDDSGSIEGRAAGAMAQDALAHAEALGYFAAPCPEALRFPDLPELEDDRDDFRRTETELEGARECARMWEGGAGAGSEVAEECAEYRAKAEALEKRLADMRAGRIPALTERQKVEAWEAERHAIVADYRRRLEAAGVDASWVELPRSWRLARLDGEEV